MMAYAAQTDPVLAVASASETDPGAGESEHNDDMFDEGTAGSSAKEQAQDPGKGEDGREQDVPDVNGETPGTEENPQEPENPDTEEENPQEPEVPDTEEENPQEPENPDTEEENPQEPEVPDTEEENPQEPENPDTEEENPQEPEIPDTEGDIPDESGDNQPEEAENTVSGNSLSENTLSAAAFSARTSEVTPIDFEAASKEGVQVTLPPYTNQNNYVWYSFTAPKAGRYAFYTKEGFSRAVSIGVYGAPDKDSALRVTSSSSPQALTVTTNYMEKGETVYFGTYTYKEDGSLTYTMWAAYQTALTKNGDGSYTAKLSDGDAVTLRPRAGKSRIQVEVVKGFNSSHVLQACVCPADHSEGDSFVPRDSGIDASTPGKTTCTGILSEGSYETSFVISRNAAQEGFVALLTGMDPIAIKGASSEDIVYVHDAVCEKNSITLDMEFLVNRYLKCRYQPVDGSAKAQTIALNNWRKYVFGHLDEGKQYRFEILDGASNEVLKTLTYSTQDTRVDFEDAVAEISEDFSTLTVKANPRYDGTEGIAYLSCRMTDTERRECTFSKSLQVSDRKPGSYFTVNFDTAETGLFLKPAVRYVAEIGMTFHRDGVSTVRMQIDDVRSPKMAYLEETDIAFQVEQEVSDANGNPQVKLTAAVQRFTGSKKVAVFYRPVNGLREYEHCVIELKEGKGEQVLGLPMASMGTNYEFVLTAGGAEKRVTCSIENELGVHLERVPAASDEVGPFHFVHTYRLTGDGKLTDSYYLQLQAYSLLPTDKWGYKNVGEPVELNGTNGYQTVFSTAAAGWVPDPDCDYRLRWLVGKSADVDTYSKDLLAVSYESLRTGKPHITLERVGGSCNSQGHKITLGEADVAVLKEYDCDVTLYRYIRKKGEQTYTKSSLDYVLGPSNNYSDTMFFELLREDTEYEFSVRDESGERIYATDVFRTPRDSRSVVVTKTVSHVKDVELHYALTGCDRYTKDYVKCYYRLAGFNGTWKEISSRPATQDGSFLLSVLKEATDYEYLIGFARELSDDVPFLTHTVRGTVTTRTDTRRIEADIKSQMTSARIRCHMFNMDVTGTNRICFLYRERGQEQWKVAGEKLYSSAEEIWSFSLDNLKEDTIYEYQTGFKVLSSDPIVLEHVVEGEFRTAADRRIVEIAPVVRTYSAKIGYTLSDMEGADAGYLLGYFRKASETGDAAWKKVYTVRTGEKPMEDMFLLGDLEEDTAYELIMGFGIDENTSRDALKRPQTFAFTTIRDGRSLSEAEAVVDDVHVTLRVKFSGNVENHASYLHFFCREEGETAYQKVGRVVNVSNVDEETAAVTVNGDDFKKETKYEFAAVLTDDITCGKPEDADRDAYRAFGSFTTLEAVKPMVLKISKEQLHLNANALYAAENGIGFADLKVQFEPLEASADLVWESSDKTVAKVTADGRVSAVAAGTATITASSAYAPEVSVSCEVTVGHYQIGRKGADGSISLVEGAKLNAARGDSCGGYVLCKTVGTNLVEVPAKISSGNESVAKWTEDGTIETKRAGETRVVFTSEADQVKAFLTVSVQPAAGKGFAITGFKSSTSAYPAVKEDAKDEAGRTRYTMAYTGGSITYTALGEIMPSRPGFDSGDFNWSIDDPKVAAVDEKGNITPLKAGSVLLRVEPKNTDDTVLYQMQPCEVALHFKELPTYDGGMFWVLENTHKKLGDVKFPENSAGWKWKYPDTPIVTNGENQFAYSFQAVYEGEEYYPKEREVSVKMGKVTGLTASEAEGGNHNHVLEVGSADEEGNPAEGSDSLTICVEALFGGDIRCNPDRKAAWFEINTPAGTVVKEERVPGYGHKRRYKVTALKKGNYTFQPVLKVMDPKTNREKILAKTSFKIQAVEEKQAYITIAPEEAAGVYTEPDRIVIYYSGNVKTFRVRATLLDRNRKEEAAFEKVKLNWSVSDGKVAKAKASRDTHTADITVVGEGHTILTAKAKDKAGHTSTVQIEIRNRAPRVDVSKVTVNPAYDFESDEGKRLACENGGAVEVASVYGIISYDKIRLFKKDKKTPEDGLELTAYEEGGKYCYLVCPTDSVEEKTYDCYLGVEFAGVLAEPFFHPLKVTVKTKRPQVTVKSVRPANLFYRTEPASVDIGIAQKGVVIESVRWTDSVAGEDNGFSSVPSDYAFDTVKKGKNVERLYFAQRNIRLTERNALAEKGIVSGKIKIRYQGYTEAVEKPVSLKWKYKKPAIVTQAKESTLIPSLDGHAEGSFQLYNNTEKQKLSDRGKDPSGGGDLRFCYNELTFQNRDVIKSGSEKYIYAGSKTKGSEKLNMTIVSDYWREPLTAVHTIKFANPTPYLTKAKLMVNTRYVGTSYTDIELKNAHTASVSCEDIIIEGKNEKSQALLDEDLLEIGQKSRGSSRIVVKLNRAESMKQEPIKNGSYDFKVTPCFRDALGNRIEGKMLTLKIQATDKEVKAKVKLSGTLDLAKDPKEVSPDTIHNYVDVSTTLQNLGYSHSYDNKKGLSLVGEYSDYFSLSSVDSKPGVYRIRIKETAASFPGEVVYGSCLKAGQRYRLAVCFTLKLENGDTIKVQSQTFTIRPKQSVPKVTVHGSGQTLYAGNDGITRSCGFELPEGMGYRIKAVSGGLDCNRDGKEDITVSWENPETESHYAEAKLSLSDRDGVLTVSGISGKTYTVPVTIKLKGRDGITKDVKTSIKVIVRR